MGKSERGNKATEKFVKEKLEDLAFKIQDWQYEECAKIFNSLVQNTPLDKDKLVNKIDDVYADYVQDLSRSIMMSGKEEHVNALIQWDAAKIAAKSFLFHRNTLLNMNLQKVDSTQMPIKIFEDELNTFAEFLVSTKKSYLSLFSEQNELVLENIPDTK